MRLQKVIDALLSNKVKKLNIVDRNLSVSAEMKALCAALSKTTSLIELAFYSDKVEGFPSASLV